MNQILAALREYFPNFSARFASVEAALAKVTAAEDRVKALEADLVKANQALESEKSEHSKTRESLQKAQTEVNEAGTKIKTLETSVETEKNRANETLASQGLNPEQLPVGSASGGEPKDTAWKTYQKLLQSDPKAAGTFYAENADRILNSRPK